MNVQSIRQRFGIRPQNGAFRTDIGVMNLFGERTRMGPFPKKDPMLIRSYFVDPLGTLLLKDEQERTATAVKICNMIGIWKTAELFVLPRALPTELKGVAV